MSMNIISIPTITLDPVTGFPTAKKPCCHSPSLLSSVGIKSPCDYLWGVASGIVISSLVVTLCGRYCKGKWASCSTLFGSKSSSCCSSTSSSSSSSLSSSFPFPSPSLSLHDNGYPQMSVESVSDLNSTLSETEEKKNPSTTIFTLAFAAHDEKLGRPWCMDCVNASPIISQVMSENAANVIVIEILIPKLGYKETTHPMRTHTEFQLTSVPTLYAMKENGKVGGKLVESELFDIGRVRKFVKSAIQENNGNNNKVEKEVKSNQ